MKNINDINELRFCLTEDMNNTFIELIITKQLLEQFRLEFQRNNIEQIKLYKELINK